MTSLEQCLIDHEGLKHHAYLDSVGVCTIGIGRNLSTSGPGLSTEECFYLLGNDIARVRQELLPYTWFKFQDIVRREVLIELGFALGLPKLLTFKKMLAAMDKKDYKTACKELHNSKWATQVAFARVDNICQRLITGSYLGR